jgi:hypothetical protein
VQEVELLSQAQNIDEQELEQVSQAGEENSQERESLSQVSLMDDIPWMSIEDFALAAGKTQQGVSYLMNKGRLKEFKDEGIRIKKTDKWYLDAALVELVKTEKALKTVEEKDALNNQLRNVQTALVKYREFEKRIVSLENENSELVQQVQGLKEVAEKQVEELQADKEKLSQEVQELKDDTELQIQSLRTEKENLSLTLQKLADEVALLKSKPWWMFW